MNYYKVLILSQPGKGKTYSTRNLNPATTGYVNCEEKPLPFKNQFKYYTEPRNYKEAYNSIIEFGKNDEIDSIVVDSFSAYFEFVLIEARATKKNFDIWNLYNAEIQKLMMLIKRCPKHMFIFGHEEYINTEGSQEKRAKVKGGNRISQILCPCKTGLIAGIS